MLLLDEPTNALDPDHRARLTDILAGLPQAMLVVSHDLPFLARIATRAVLVEAGRVRPAAMRRHAHAHEHLHVEPLD